MKINKYIVLISIVFIVLIKFSGCKEDQIGQFPTDDIAPGPVSNVTVENMPGAAKLTYEIPDDLDLLYVKTLYTLDNGQEMEKKTSAFSNEMTIKGFGTSKKHNIELIAVDRSQNESTPVVVEIEPGDSPIYQILDSLKYETVFGGFSLSWENLYEEDIIVEVLKKDESSDEFINIETFYSSAAEVENSVRGQDSVLTTFGIVIRDTYENYTDTLMMSLKPYFEEQIPSEGFTALDLNSRYVLHTSSSQPSLTFGLDKAWDGIKNVYFNWFYIKPGNLIMPYFTFDMGVEAKISRITLWQRSDYLYALHNPKTFEVYGTNDLVTANNAENDDWAENPSWIKIGEFNSYKPSGDDSDVTSEDEEFALAGEDFDFPTDAPTVRYLRFNIIETWSSSTGFHIGEMEVYGDISN